VLYNKHIKITELIGGGGRGAELHAEAKHYAIIKIWNDLFIIAPENTF
jgi:hypothetical protein